MLDAALNWTRRRRITTSTQLGRSERWSIQSERWSINHRVYIGRIAYYPMAVLPAPRKVSAAEPWIRQNTLKSGFREGVAMRSPTAGTKLLRAPVLPL